jgi:flagellar biogenesis protein FliO
MQFMTALFGGSESAVLNSAFALGIVLVLIVLGLWALKLLTNATGRMAATRHRLVVVDKAQVDGKRQVVIIRRDDVEHVIMTGGPTDLVIESGVSVTPSPVPPRRAAPAQAASAQSAPQQTHAAEQVVAPPPPAPEHPVPREAVDRLFDLARPAPLKPRNSMRVRNLLRREVIPMSPELRVDNTAAPPADSAKPDADGTNGQLRLGARGRYFRGVIRGDR